MFKHLELQNDTIQPAVVRKRGAVRGTEEDGRKGLETSSFKRAKGESAKRFLERVDRETNDQLMEHYRKSKQKSSKKKLCVCCKSFLVVILSAFSRYIPLHIVAPG